MKKHLVVLTLLATISGVAPLFDFAQQISTRLPSPSSRYFDGSAGCGSGTTTATKILATFNGTTDIFEIGFGTDEVNWCSGFVIEGANGGRDPRLIKFGSTYYLFWTSGSPNWGCMSSSDGKAWSSNTNISVTGGVPSPTNVWAPSPFVDTDGSFHVLVSISTNSETTFQIYEMHPTSTGNLCSQTWSNPTQITVTGESHSIDAWVSCVDSTTDALCSASPTTPVYYLFYTTCCSITTEYGQLASASSLAGTYTVQKTGDWANWLGTTDVSVEGQQLVSEGSGSWRMFFDFVNPSGLTAGQLYYSDCTSGAACFTTGADWSAKIPLATAPYQAKHGTVYPYP